MSGRGRACEEERLTDGRERSGCHAVSDGRDHANGVAESTAPGIDGKWTGREARERVIAFEAVEMALKVPE